MSSIRAPLHQKPRLGSTLALSSTILAFTIACSGESGDAGADGVVGTGDGDTSAGGSTATDTDSSSDPGSSSGGGVGDGAAGGAAGDGTSSSQCWSGDTITWTATDYVSRKWARWPIPNTVDSGLPHPMSYTEVADGVRDDVTGLIWQKSTSPTNSTWQEALAYCENLGPGWTLPTRIELTTILHHDKSGAAIDSVFEFGASAGWTWASTPWVVNERKDLTGDAALSWFINFAVGDSNNSLSQTEPSASSRCVQVQNTMTLPAEHYSVQAGEVRDNYTCLTWQRAGSGTTPSLTRQQAISYCEDLDLGGHSWRLPSLNELASLVDDVPTGDVSPAIDHDAFPETSPDAKYWSTSGYGNPADSYWTLNFEDGFTEHDNDGSTSLGIARCVR